MNDKNLMIKDFSDIKAIAVTFAKSGLFQDARDEVKACVKIMAGAELGIPPFAAMTGISIINGKPCIGSNLMAASLKKSGKYNYKVKCGTDKQCTIEFWELGHVLGEYTFTIEDAVRAGLASKDVWKKYPKAMLFARAISAGIRFYCPDLFLGGTYYTPEEMGAEVDEDGNVFEGEVLKEEEQPLIAGEKFTQLTQLLDESTNKDATIEYILKKYDINSLVELKEKDADLIIGSLINKKGESND